MLELWCSGLIGPALALLLLRALPARGRSPGVWLDALLGLGAALWLGLTAARSLAPFYLRASLGVTTTDFSEYCGLVGSWILRRPGSDIGQRSIFAAWPPARLAEALGLVDAMAATGALSVGLIGLGLYLWGRALGGRAAGLFAVLAAATLGPLVVLSRTLSFYPLQTAIFVLGAGVSAMALQRRSAPWLLVCGAAAGLALLIDPRGLFYALPQLGLGLLAALVGPPKAWRGLRGPLRLVLRLGALALPVYASWRTGPQAYGNAMSLEAILAAPLLMQTHGAHVAAHLPTWGGQYRWGISPLWDLPTTFEWIRLRTAARPPRDWEIVQGEAALAAALGPLRPALLGGALLALGAARRAPARLLGLLGSAAPFVAALPAAVYIQAGASRYLAGLAPLAALLLGLGAAALLGRPQPQRVLPAALFGLALVLGWLPSALEPGAPWRKVEVSDGADEVTRMIDRSGKDQGAIDPAGREGLCLTALARDRARKQEWPDLFSR